MIKRKTMNQIIKQLFVIMSLITAFFCSAYYALHKIVPFRRLYLAIMIMICLCGLCYILYVYGDTIRKIKVDRNIILLVIVTAIPRVIQLNDMARNDGAVYFECFLKACNQFHFNMETLDTFNLATHPTLGFSLLCAIGYYLIPTRMIGINLVKLILVELMVIFLYRIFQHVFQKANCRFCVLCTVFVCSLPIFTGTFSAFSTDIGVPIFFIYVIYFFMKKEYILTIFWMFVLFETKESGVIVGLAFWGSYGVLYFINRILHEKDKKKKKNLIFFSVGSVVLLLITLCFIVSSWQWEGGVTDMLFPDTERTVNYVGFSKRHILIKLAQIFVLNFAWIIWGIIIVGSVTLIIRKVKVFSENGIFFASLMMTGIAYFIFQLFYITYEHPRYDYILAVIIGMVTCVLMYYVKGKYVNWVIGGVSILMLIQAFITIDPLTLRIFPNVKTGGWPMVSDILDLDSGTMSNDYNYQYMYQDRMIEKLLANENYNGQDIFLFGTLDGEVLGTDYNYMYWDTVKKRRDAIQNGDMVQMNACKKLLNDIPVIHKQINRERTTNDAIMIIYPWYEYNEEELIHKLEKVYGEISERKEVREGIYGNIYYYILRNSIPLEDD